MIAIIDYGMGNLRSVVNGFEMFGAEVRVTAEPRDLRDASAIVVPGVGAFGDGMDGLARLGLIEALEEEVMVRKKPFLGICLGMQFLASQGLEHGSQAGLGWLGGIVKRIEPHDPLVKVPHMGWNDLRIERRSVLLEGIDESVFYFVHSYYLDTAGLVEGAVTSTCWHGLRFPATVEHDNIFGVQFHPEKSQRAGLRLLKNFAQLT